MKPIPLKRVQKRERERRVLLGTIDLYLATGRPVGSNTLRESGFENLSSATIRNYFAYLEEEGYLKQQHTSGGRIPTDKGYRLYAAEHEQACEIAEHHRTALTALERETKEVTAYLTEVGELVSQLTECATFISAPRFDHDFVLDIKLLALDPHRCLCAMVTDFGSIVTEIIATDVKLTTFSIHRLESYLSWRLSGLDKPENLTEEEELLAKHLYNEAMVRFITRYSSFRCEEVYRSGFSRLLAHPEFNSPNALANGLSLFEDRAAVRTLLSECQRSGELRYWIGDDLAPVAPLATHGAVVAIPYAIHRTTVGAIGLYGPLRLPYREQFALLRAVADRVSESLSKSLYKFQIQYRQPEVVSHRPLIGEGAVRLLENKPVNPDPIDLRISER